MRNIFIIASILIVLVQLLISKDLLTNSVLADSLVAYYPFNGNADDESGNGHNGIVYNALLADDRYGYPNRAYGFDGINDEYVYVMNPEFLNLTDEGTISVWLNIFSYENRANDTYWHILGKGAKAGWDSDGYSIFYHNSAQVIFGVLTNTSQISRYNRISFGKPSINEWHHLVMVWNDSLIKAYFDGQQFGEQVLKTINVPQTSENFIIGKKPYGTYNGYFNGIIDEIRLYNRALTVKEIEFLFFGPISANFIADTTFGIAPFTVNFIDQTTTTDSINKICSWKWDFDNDGVNDSEEQNPEWTYYEQGIYTVKLLVSDSLNKATISKEKYIAVLSENPFILSVTDVPSDQGGWVKVEFTRSVFDTDTLILAKTSSTELYTIEVNEGLDWTAVASTGAYGKSTYSVLVPTSKDSTLENDGLLNFRVIAGMEEGNFVSDVVTGYSKDNLHPSAPQELAGYITQEEYAKLTWQPIPERDFEYYQIYISNDGTSFELIDSTINSAYTDDTVVRGNSYYYSVKSVDFSGNESEFSNIIYLMITDINSKLDIPTTYYLLQNYPNPFNPQTTIKYGLLDQSTVTIKIYDILGQTIRELVNAKQNPGHHRVIWDGRNNSGQVVSTGIYYYRIETENYSSMKKVLFVK